MISRRWNCFRLHQQTDLKQTSASQCTIRKVYVAAFSSLLLAIAVGQGYGFSATALEDMDTIDSPIHPSKEMKTWIASIFNIGELLGCLLAAPLSQKAGRRQGLIISSIPFIGGWLCISETKTEALLIFGRVVTGVCSGLLLTIVPIYLIEISSTDIRGRLGGSFLACLGLGFLISNVIGWVFTWSMLARFSIITPVISIIIMFFIPESPKWLVSTGRRERALRAISFLHGSVVDPAKEVEAIEEDLREQSKTEGLTCSDMRKAIFWKPAILSLFLMFFGEFSGICVFLFFTVEIFKSAATTIDSNLSTVIVSSMQLLAAIIAATVMDRVGRRLLLNVSAIGMAIGLSGLGTYFYLKDHVMVAQHVVLNYLPLVSLICYMAFYNVGYGPIPWIMQNELSPLKARSLICGLATFFKCCLSFGITKTFSDFQIAVGTYGPFWIFALSCLVSIFFVCFFIPETKGKPLEDILQFFTKKNTAKTPIQEVWSTHL